MIADVPLVDKNPLGSIADWIHVHRRGEVTPPAVDGEPATTVPQEKPALSDAAVPVALAAEQSTSALPGILVLGFAGLLLLVLLGGGTHLLVVRRRLLLAEAKSPEAGSTVTSEAPGETSPGKTPHKH